MTEENETVDAVIETPAVEEVVVDTEVAEAGEEE